MDFFRNDAPQPTSSGRLLKYRLLRLFSERYRDKLEQHTIDPRLRVVLNHSVVTDDCRLLYVKNSKAGCTSVTHLLYFYNRGKEFDERFRSEIHNTSDLKKGVKNWKTLKCGRNRPCTFSFVRDPLTRILSAYHDFCSDQRNPNSPQHLGNMQRMGFHAGLPERRKFDLFLDYVEMCMADSRLFCDRHWRLQKVNLGMDVMSYDFIGRVENYRDDMRAILLHIGRFDLVDSPLLERRYNRSKATSARLQPTAVQKQRIQRIYRDDYECFGYPLCQRPAGHTHARDVTGHSGARGALARPPGPGC